MRNKFLLCVFCLALSLTARSTLNASVDEKGLRNTFDKKEDIERITHRFNKCSVGIVLGVGSISKIMTFFPGFGSIIAVGGAMMLEAICES